MKVIKPTVITEAMLISSTVPETDHAAYAAGTDYGVGDRRVYAHKIYESVQTPNTGHTPDVSPLYWAEISATNQWLMFDSEVSTQTVDATTMVIVMAPGIINSMALVNIDGTQVDIEITDGLAGPVVYTHSQALDGSVILDWFQYFFLPQSLTHEVILTDLPGYANAHVKVTLTGGGDVKIGSAVFGFVYDIGDTKYGASVGIIDYSRKDTSPTGVTTFTKRKFSKRMSAQVEVNNALISDIFRTITELRATPCMWIGTNAAGFEPLNIFGFYKDFSIEVAYPTTSYCSLEIEGLT